MICHDIIIYGIPRIEKFGGFPVSGKDSHLKQLRIHLGQAPRIRQLMI